MCEVPVLGAVLFSEVSSLQGVLIIGAPLYISHYLCTYTLDICSSFFQTEDSRVNMIVERVVNTHYHSCPRRQNVVGECNDDLCRYFTWHLNHHTTHRQHEYYSESRIYGEIMPLGKKES